MVKTLKVLKIIIIILGVGAILSLVFLNIGSFIATSKRLCEIGKIDSLKNYFEVYNENSKVIYSESINEIEEWANNVVEEFHSATSKSFKDHIISFLNGFLDFLFNFIIYFCNYGINIILILYLTLHETFAGTQQSTKTSLLAGIWLRFDKILDSIKQTLKKGVNTVIHLLSIHRRKIFLTLVLILAANGFLYKIIVELIIFFITYIMRMINLETYVLIFEIFKFIFTILFPYLKYIPTWIWIPTLFVLLFAGAVARANYKLALNHKRLKKFANEDLTQTTFINGPPGTGKTLLNVSLSLASEENFIEELESKLLDYEIKYKNINFAKIRQNPKDYPEHKEYIDLYEKLSNRDSYLISNYTIHSPYFDDHSKSWDFEYMRKNIKYPGKQYPLEEYIIISISEFDKEYNSHDDKKSVGEDGVATFFSTVSHDLKRHVKVFIDYQLKDQVPLRIRGNAEYFITIKSRKKKYPILLFAYYLPFKILYQLCKHFIRKYELKKKFVEKKSQRKGLGVYKRNDLTLPYLILRELTLTLSKICNWFDHYYYFRLSTIVSQEDDAKGKEKILNINISDLSYKDHPLYDSTFLSFAYEEMHNAEFKNLYKNKTLRPSIEELRRCHSKFYDKLIGDLEENNHYNDI